MLVAYKLWGSAPEGTAPIGMPLEVPWMNSFIEDEEVDVYRLKGYTVSTEEEYASYLDSISTAVDTYLASKDELENLAYVKGGVELAIKFGHNLINEYGAKNTLRGYTAEQVAVVAQALFPISMLLTSGALYTALGAIQATPTTELITDEDKTEFMTKIMDYLGLEG